MPGRPPASLLLLLPGFLTHATQVSRPTKALGPISGGGWQVQALAAGYQHALAVAANKGGSWEIKQQWVSVCVGGKGPRSCHHASNISSAYTLVPNM